MSWKTSATGSGLYTVTYTFVNIPTQATADASTGLITIDTSEEFYAPNLQSTGSYYGGLTQPS